MARKDDAQIALLREVLAELRRLNANLERRAAVPEIPAEEAPDDESEDMDEFE